MPFVELVDPAQWLYWGIAVPLTVIVLVAWPVKEYFLASGHWEWRRLGGFGLWMRQLGLKLKFASRPSSSGSEGNEDGDNLDVRRAKVERFSRI